MAVFTTPNNGFESEEHRQLIEEYQNNYQDEHLMKYPEFCQKKLNLHDSILSCLPEIESRTRNQVINWMIRNLSYDQLRYTGW